jgi:hypothetical protein
MALAAKLAKKGAKSKAPSKGKGKPEVRLTCVQEIKDYAKALRDKKDAEARLNDFGKLIWEEAEEALISESRRLNAVQTSLRLNGLLTLIAKNGQYCMIPAMAKDGESESDESKELKEKFGDQFDEFFVESNDLSVKAEVLDDSLIEALSEACDKVGKSFGDIFNVKSVIKPTEVFTTKRIMSDDVRKAFNEVRDSGIVRPYKPTLKE